MEALGELIQLHSPDVINLFTGFSCSLLLKLDLPVLTFILIIAIFFPAGG
jgi:hypothetical protein